MRKQLDTIDFFIYSAQFDKRTNLDLWADERVGGWLKSHFKYSFFDNFTIILAIILYTVEGKKERKSYLHEKKGIV